jgi:hypothetical protein
MTLMRSLPPFFCYKGVYKSKWREQPKDHFHHRQKNAAISHCRVPLLGRPFPLPLLPPTPLPLRCLLPRTTCQQYLRHHFTVVARIGPMPFRLPAARHWLVGMVGVGPVALMRMGQARELESDWARVTCRSLALCLNLRLKGDANVPSSHPRKQANIEQVFEIAILLFVEYARKKGGIQKTASRVVVCCRVVVFQGPTASRCCLPPILHPSSHKK